MNIAEALRCGRGIKLAAVGAGGKSSLLFALSRQIPGKVIVTTTTHFAIDQLALGDLHLTDVDASLIQKIHTAHEDAVIVISGTDVQKERINGPSPENLEKIKSVCDEKGYTFLVEADGSRKLPLKAYGDNEPVIPAWIDLVVFVVGCRAIGNPLDDEHVFRAGIFAEVSDTPFGETVHVDAICRMLIHPKGGLKHWTAYRRSVILFNQADHLSQEDRKSIEKEKDNLLEHHDAVLIAALKPGGAVDKQEIQCFERVAGVILAAGESARLGYPKQLLTYHHISFLRSTTLKILESGVSNVYVVLGYQAERMRQEVADLPVTILDNEAWASGQSSSVKQALSEIQNHGHTGGILFLPVDQPFLTKETLKELINLHASHCGTTIVPVHAGQPGSPVLFDWAHFDQLAAISGDKGGRSILNDIQTLPYNVQNEKELLDIDTMDLYQTHIHEMDFTK
jgi:molybdenum cofactor cytidylyltransferase